MKYVPIRLPVPREPECSITHTASASSRQISMKWLPPPSVPICRSTLSGRIFGWRLRIAASRCISPDCASWFSMLSGMRWWSPPGPLPTGTPRSIELRRWARSSGRSLARSVVRTAAMPQPMSTPTAAGMIAPRVGTTEPTVAPMPRCTSGMTATHGPTNGSEAMLRSCWWACGSNGTPCTQPLIGVSLPCACRNSYWLCMFMGNPFFERARLERLRAANPFATRRLLLLQADQLLDDAVQAAEHREPVDLLRDLLQGLQLLQAHQHRALLDQARRVQQRTGGVGLLATTDHVGLGRLLRLHDAIEDLLHLARQDHVLDAHAEHLDAQLGHSAAHVAEDVGVERGLVAEQFVQRLGGDRLTQAVLQLAVHVVAVLGDLGTRGHRVGDADARGQVHAQAHLVMGQQFLAGDFHRLH